MTDPDPLAEYQAASNDIHDITDGPGQHAWAAFYKAWMDGVQAVQEQARAEGAIAERRRIRRELIDGDPGMLEVRFRQFLDDEDAADCMMIVADLLEGDGDV